jgi:hypothetical protein
MDIFNHPLKRGALDLARDDFEGAQKRHAGFEQTR